MKSSPSIWRYVVNAKSMVKILSIFVSFLWNMSFTAYFQIFEVFSENVNFKNLFQDMNLSQGIQDYVKCFR